MKKWLSLPLVLVSVLTIASCASVETLDSIKNSGDSRVRQTTFDAPKDKVFEAALNATMDAGLDITSQNKDEGRIYAKSLDKMEWNRSGMGQLVGIYVSSVGDNKTAVDIVTRKKWLADTGFTDYRVIILNNLRRQLGYSAEK